jgi:pilus assembly protein Flp/PilA
MCCLTAQPPKSIEKHSRQGTTLLKSAKAIGLAFFNFVRDETGQDLIEYALVAGLIGLGAVVAMSGLSTKIRSAFNSVGNSLTNAL